MGVIQGSKGCDARLCESFMYLGAEIILKTNNTWYFIGLQNIKNLSQIPQFSFPQKNQGMLDNLVLMRDKSHWKGFLGSVCM